MSAGIPEHLDIRRLARQGAHFEGRMALASMPRIAALAHDTSGGVDVIIDIARDAAGNDIVTGQARGTLALECQRCLEPVAHDIATEFKLQCVTDADARCADPDYEPLVVGEESITASELIEDELILALPAIAVHADIAECGRLAQLTSAGDEEVEDDVKENPFAVLRDLKQDR